MNIAILVCDNGFGHMRRSLSIALNLTKFGHTVEIFGNKVGYENVVKAFKLKNIPFRFIESNFSYNLKYFTNGFPEKFSIKQNFPDLDNYDFVLSDNILEVLEIRPDTILIAQFFWHEIIPKVNQEYKSKCRNLIQETSPIIFGDKYFSMRHIKESFNYVPVGLHALNLLKDRSYTEEKESRKNLLISGGNTQYAKNLFSRYIQYIIKNPITDVDIVFVDKNIMPSKFPSWIKEATFDQEMYKSLIACICRPGLGTITENIYYGVKVFTLFEDDNLEMIHNSIALKKLNLGENLLSIDSFNEQICNFIKNKGQIHKHFSNCESIDFEGSIQVCEKISEILFSKNLQ